MTDRKIKILIVDDIPSNVRLLEAIIGNHDYEIISAYSAYEALEMAKKHKPAIILLDIMMPQMNGFEICKEIKSDLQTSDCSIIFVTAKNSTDDKVKALELGAVDYITKPFEGAEVLARINAHTSHYRTRNLLSESEKNYSLLLENIKEGIMLWTPDSGIIFANSSLARMLKITRDEILLKKLEDIFHEKDIKNVKSIFSGMIINKTQTKSEDREFNFRMLDSDNNVIHVACLPVFISYSDTPSVLVTIRDITERMNLEKELRHVQKMEALGTLTSGIAHDFNNILSLINGYSELAVRELNPGTEIYEKIKIINEAGKSAASLTKGLLAFGRKKAMVFEPVNLMPEIKSTVKFIEKGLPADVLIIFKAETESARTLADAAMIQQAIVNLCLNARDAMPDGGLITVTVSKRVLEKVPPYATSDAVPGRYICISVKDQGLGIPENIISNIFDPFFTTKVDRGSGLGLAMVERITRNHKGWIQLSTEENSGTEFSLMIPEISSDETEPDTVSYKHNTHRELNKIIVADDDESFLSMVRYILEKESYEVISAYSAIEALKIIESNSKIFNLAILDHSMPKMTGSECANIIREKYPHIKILIISGAENIPDAGDSVLRKPFTIPAFLKELDNFAE